MLFSYLSGGNHHNLFKVVQSHDRGADDSSTEHAVGTKHVAERTHVTMSDTRDTSLTRSQRHLAEGGATMELQNQVVISLIKAQFLSKTFHTQKKVCYIYFSELRKKKMRKLLELRDSR